MPRADDPQADAQHRLGRIQSRKVEKWRAVQRLIGSSVLGGIAAWRLFVYEPPTKVDAGFPWILGVWLGLAFLAFGLASWDQILKALKR